VSKQGSHHWKHYDRMFIYSALACFATSVLGAFLLRAAFYADPSDTGIPKNYALALCCCLIVSLPIYLITLKSSKLGAIAMWILTSITGALATCAGAFGLVTPIIAVFIFAASIASHIWHKHTKVILANATTDSLESGS
jgi:hypothetical protein